LFDVFLLLAVGFLHAILMPCDCVFVVHTFLNLTLHFVKLGVHCQRVHVAEHGLAGTWVEADSVLGALVVLVIIKAGLGHIHGGVFVTTVLRNHHELLALVFARPVAVLLHSTAIFQTVHLSRVEIILLLLLLLLLSLFSIYRNQHRVASGPASDSATLSHDYLWNVAAGVERVCHTRRLLNVLHIKTRLALRQSFKGSNCWRGSIIHSSAVRAVAFTWHRRSHSPIVRLHDSTWRSLFHSVIALINDGLRHNLLVLLAMQDLQVVVLSLVVRLVVRWCDLNVGNRVHIILKGLIAARVRHKVNLAVLMKFFELVKLLLCRLREHIDHRLDLLCHLCRVPEGRSLRLHPLNQNLLQLLWSAPLIRRAIVLD